jgi:hypothetical protein
MSDERERRVGMLLMMLDMAYVYLLRQCGRLPIDITLPEVPSIKDRIDSVSGAAELAELEPMPGLQQRALYDACCMWLAAADSYLRLRSDYTPWRVSAVTASITKCREDVDVVAAWLDSQQE